MFIFFFSNNITENMGGGGIVTNVYTGNIIYRNDQLEGGTTGNSGEVWTALNNGESDVFLMDADEFNSTYTRVAADPDDATNGGGVFFDADYSSGGTNVYQNTTLETIDRLLQLLNNTALTEFSLSALQHTRQINISGTGPLTNLGGGDSAGAFPALATVGVFAGSNPSVDISVLNIISNFSLDPFTGTAADFPKLTQVFGGISILDNGVMITMGTGSFPLLENIVGGASNTSLLITNNPLLTTIADFTSLNEITKDIRILANACLVTMANTVFGALDYTGGIEISGNIILTTIPTFLVLRYCTNEGAGTGNIVIHGNDALKNVGAGILSSPTRVFPALESVTGYITFSSGAFGPGNIVIKDDGTQALETINGFDALVTVGTITNKVGNFSADTNATLTTISGFGEITEVTGNVEFANNDELITIPIFSLLVTIIGNLEIDTNAKIKTATFNTDGFIPVLTTVIGSLNIIGNINTNFTEITNFGPEITSIGSGAPDGGSLTITGNTSLNNLLNIFPKLADVGLDGFVGNITITGNDATGINIRPNATLGSFIAMTGIAPVRVWGSVNIEDVLDAAQEINLEAKFVNPAGNVSEAVLILAV